jgi:myo-inositol-1(or 4)-monophosphatase
MKENLSSLTRTVRDCLLAGGAILKRGASRPKKVRYKNPTSPVTQIDLASERSIISLIKNRFPSHSFLAEESGVTPPPAPSHKGRGKEYRWVIDPLDGTVNYVHGFPQSSVSIAVEKGGRVLAGGVYDPYRNELFLATRGRGATLNGKKIHVSSVNRLKDTMVVTGFPYDRKVFAHELASVMEVVFRANLDIRRVGSAALDLSWIACGRSDVYFEFKLSPWDMAAGWLLVEEAGGRLTDMKGKAIDLDLPNQLLATNGRVHTAAVQLLKKASIHIEKITRI